MFLGGLKAIPKNHRINRPRIGYLSFMNSRTSIAAIASLFCLFISMAALAAPPAVGEEAADFELKSLAGETVKLSKVTADSPVVLVVLRGYPGYQCPICTKLFADYLKNADAFKKAGTQVLFVYPGPAAKLKEHADEFVKGKDYPTHFQFLLDPDYTFTNAYSLRWEEKGETAYPSTFVIDKNRKITFAKVSHSHGDRAKVADVIKALDEK